MKLQSVLILSIIYRGDKMKKGLIQIYTGNGKGKSTALFGLGIRAIGRKRRVLIIQFLKARETGEVMFLKEVNPKNLVFKRVNTSRKFSWNMDEEEKAKAREEVLEGMKWIIDNQGDFDLVLCDELVNCIGSGSISEEELLEFMNKKENHVELVMTGRDASEKLVEKADLVSEMKKIKHPFDKGINAREAIEF